MRTLHAVGFLLFSACVVGAGACSSTSSVTPPPDSGAAQQVSPDASSGTDGGWAGDGGVDAPDSAPPEAAALAKITLNIPTDFTGDTRQLNVVLVETVPPKTMPSAILVQQNKPTLVAGQPLNLTADISGVTKGDYYVLAVIYMVGGGKTQPTAGKDYVASSKAKVTFDGTSVDLGTLELAKAEGP